MVIDDYTFENIFWVNKEHTAFNVDVIAKSGERYPFTYLVDGSDDNDSEISTVVKKYFNQFEILEYPKSLELFHSLQKAGFSRNYRNKLLTETDKYMTLDYPISEENRNLLRVYRQALRDVPQQEGFPESVTWPNKPDCI